MFNSFMVELTLEDNGRYIKEINRLVYQYRELHKILNSYFGKCDLEYKLKDCTNKINMFVNDLEMFNLILRINNENKKIINVFCNEE